MNNDSLDKARKEINEIDRDIARLFERRMNAVRQVAEYKASVGMPVLDKEREALVIERGATMIENQTMRPYYIRFIKDCMAISRDYQEELLRATDESSIRLSTDSGSYTITIKRGGINLARDLFDLKRRTLIVTDSGVPSEYAECVARQCKEAKIITLPQGEGSKSFACIDTLCQAMLDFGMTRSDCVVAVGGGVVGDLAGFAAASFMRGIDFYNIPTTLLSQVDSSIGGKTAINLGGVKNIVGAFYQPKGVIIDPEVLSTLTKRQLSAGLAEAIKMSLTSDKELFELIERGDTEKNIEEIITRSLLIKKAVVEADEREGGLRRILNFGHSFGHGVEAAAGGKLYHGECVAIGMTVTCSNKVKARLIPLLERVGLPTCYDGDIDEALSFISHDKKCNGGSISVIFVDEIGSYRIENLRVEDFIAHVREVLK